MARKSEAPFRKSPQKRAEARAAYEAGGETYASLGKRYGVGKSTIARVAAEEGWTIQTKRKARKTVSKKASAAAVAAYTSGKSVYDIMSMLGVGRVVAERVLADTGVSLRELGEAIRCYHKDRHRVDKSFRGLADKLTQAVYEEHWPVINPHAIPRGRHAYHLDHRLSVKDADGVLSIYELCHPANLQLIPASANMSKNWRSELSAAELREQIDAWNLEHGDPYFCHDSKKLDAIINSIGEYDNYGLQLSEAVGSYYQTSDRPQRQVCA